MLIMLQGISHRKLSFGTVQAWLVLHFLAALFHTKNIAPAAALQITWATHFGGPGRNRPSSFLPTGFPTWLHVRAKNHPKPSSFGPVCLSWLSAFQHLLAED